MYKPYNPIWSVIISLVSSWPNQNTNNFPLFHSYCMLCLHSMFRIRDILSQIRIRILGSARWITDPNPENSLSGFQNKFDISFFPEGTFTSAFKDNKSLRSHTVVENKVLLYFFACLWNDPDLYMSYNNGSKTWRLKNLRILLYFTSYKLETYPTLWESSEPLQGLNLVDLLAILPHSWQLLEPLEALLTYPALANLKY